jgi:hypothetical protein
MSSESSGAQVRVPIDLTFTAHLGGADPFNDLDVDVDVTGPDGVELVLPSYWAGGSTYRARLAPWTPGTYRYAARATGATEAGLDDPFGVIEVAPYSGSNRLYRHGRLRITSDHRRFEHEDGTPFLWLGDTQWQMFTSRLDWPDGFASLEDDRAAKGFTVVHMVAGPLSGFEVDENWHPHQANEAGWPWEVGWTRINPAFYDLVDRKLVGCVDRGLMPMVVGMWGYYLNLIGIDRVRRHWRYLVARYGAFPVTWCLAGEVRMPVYSVGRAGGVPLAEAVAEQATGWTELAGHVRAIDPYHNLITTHPAAIGTETRDAASPALGLGDGSGRAQLSGSARSVLVDDAALDFDLLQCGHDGYRLLEPTVQLVQRAMAQEPPMPVVNGEVNYEGIAGTCWQEQQRFLFWTALLDGAAGFSYGAAGLWVFWSRTTFSKGGDSEYMEDAGGGPWEDVMHLPGSAQLGVGARLLESLPWSRFERIREPKAEALGRHSSFAAGIPGVVAVYFVPSGFEVESLHGILEAGEAKYIWWRTLLPIAIDTSARMDAAWIDPRTGDRTAIGPVVADADGFWQPPAKPSLLDWILVLTDTERLGRIEATGR